MSEICYKRNFLKQVVGRVEFAQPLVDLSSESLVAVIAEIKKRFPISEQATGFRQGIEISPEGVKSSKADFPAWTFYSSDRSKSFQINPHFLEVVLSKYTSETDFRDDLVNPISHIMGSRPDVIISRTGVRFINIFDFDIPSFQAISDYFSQGISGHLTSVPKPDQCVRAFLVNEYLVGEIKIRIQSGLFNPDYPAIIKRRHFVLDIDAFIDFPHKIQDISNYFRDFHRNIQEMFEAHITDKLRDEVLNV